MGMEHCACRDVCSWGWGDLWGAVLGKQGSDDQESWVRVTESLHVCQPSWLNTAVEAKIPYISSLRPNLPGICGAAELHVLEVLHGKFMVAPGSVFRARFSLLWVLGFPVQFYLIRTHTSF